MADTYYYLLAGLPELSYGHEADDALLNAVYDDILRNLSAADLEDLRYILYANDNKNLIRSIRMNAGKDPVYPQFARPAVFGEEVMERYQQNMSAFPGYMQGFIEDNSASLESMNAKQLENTLLQYFYDEAVNHPNAFISSYYEFDRDLKNIIAAFNARRYGYEMRDELIGDGEISAILVKSSANDFGLTMIYPFAAQLAAFFESDDIQGLEMEIMKIVWDFVDGRTVFSGYTAGKVYAYVVKLLLAKRLSGLDAEAGKERLQEIINEIKRNYSIPRL